MFLCIVASALASFWRFHLVHVRRARILQLHVVSMNSPFTLYFNVFFFLFFCSLSLSLFVEEMKFYWIVCFSFSQKIFLVSFTSLLMKLKNKNLKIKITLHAMRNGLSVSVCGNQRFICVQISFENDHSIAAGDARQSPMSAFGKGEFLVIDDNDKCPFAMRYGNFTRINLR